MQLCRYNSPLLHTDNGGGAMGTMLDLVDKHCGMLHRVYFFKLSKINLAFSDLIN